MNNNIPKDYITNITKASSYFIYRNGPIKELLADDKLNDDDVKKIQEYMQNHLAYLYTVLLEENNLKKFELIVSTMNKFYVNDTSEVKLSDDGFDSFYNNLFKPSKVESIKINK